MHSSTKAIAFTLACLAASPAFAADFDGSQPLICATIEARDCVLQSSCFSGEAKEVGAPAFFRVDFKQKMIHGKERSAPITSIEESPAGLLLQGVESGYALSIGINKQDGDFSASITNFEGTFLLFGYCTVL